MKLNITIGLAVGAIAALSACQPADKDTAKMPDKFDRPSQIVTLNEVKRDSGDWGDFLPHFTGETGSLSGVLTGVAQIKPGEAPHGPHKHADEEYLMLTQGEGLWYLNGESFPAKRGDILYTRPWDMHGFLNTSDEMAEFVVFKWTARHTDYPTDPDPDGPEEIPFPATE